jgi:hypothetical protein
VNACFAKCFCLASNNWNNRAQQVETIGEFILEILETNFDFGRVLKKCATSLFKLGKTQVVFALVHVREVINGILTLSLT